MLDNKSKAHEVYEELKDSLDETFFETLRYEESKMTSLSKDDAIKATQYTYSTIVQALKSGKKGKLEVHLVCIEDNALVSVTITKSHRGKRIVIASADTMFKYDNLGAEYSLVTHTGEFNYLNAEILTKLFKKYGTK